jgi:hypothetical protein
MQFLRRFFRPLLLTPLAFTDGCANYSGLPEPEDPTNLTATPVAPDQINLTWNDNAGNEEGFRIERCPGASCSNYALVASVEANVSAYQNGGLSPATTYSFRVRAYNATGTSGYSNAVTATTPT